MSKSKNAYETFAPLGPFHYNLSLDGGIGVWGTCGQQGSGGGVRVACSPTELKVPGSISGVDWIFSENSVFTLKFPLSALWHLPWTSGFSSLISFSPTFSIFHFPVQFARHTPIFFLPSSSLLSAYASCAKVTNVIYSLSLCTITHCLCGDPAIRTKLVLLISSGGRGKKWS